MIVSILPMRHIYLPSRNLCLSMSEATNQSSSKQDDKWNYYIWECTVTHPSMRPLGRKQTDGCGHHNLRKTKKTIGDESAQSKCSKCGRRKRLSKQNLYLRLFTDKKYAEKAQNELNGGVWDGMEVHLLRAVEWYERYGNISSSLYWLHPRYQIPVPKRKEAYAWLSGQSVRQTQDWEGRMARGAKEAQEARCLRWDESKEEDCRT